MDAADFGGGDNDDVRAVLSQPVFDLFLPRQIQRRPVDDERFLAEAFSRRTIADPTMPR